jgi:hypothetical protein
VREAIYRVNCLRPQGHLGDEPHFPSALTRVPQPLFTGERDGGGRVARDLVAYDDRSYPPRPGGFSGYAAPFYAPSSPAPFRPQELISESSGVSGTFVPGHETESVLKLTKHSLPTSAKG